MIAKLNEDIAETVSRQDRPLEVRDAAGKVYIVMRVARCRSGHR